MPMHEWAGKKKVFKAIGIFGFALLVLAQSTFASDPPHVFWIHGANVTAEGAHVWASEMFKRLWQAGARVDKFIMLDSAIPSEAFDIRSSVEL